MGTRLLPERKCISSSPAKAWRADRRIEYGAEIGELPVPTWEGCEFMGWLSVADGGETWTPTITMKCVTTSNKSSDVIL